VVQQGLVGVGAAAPRGLNGHKLLRATRVSVVRVVVAAAAVLTAQRKSWRGQATRHAARALRTSIATRIVALGCGLARGRSATCRTSAGQKSNGECATSFCFVFS